MDDPYYELEEYLERVKNEINQVFERYNLKHSNVQSKDRVNVFQKPKSNIDSQLTIRPKSQKEIKDEYEEWKEWTDKESSSQQYSVSSTNMKHGQNIISNCNTIIYKPEKHVTIPLQSFTIPEQIMTPTESKSEHFFKTDRGYDMSPKYDSEAIVIPSQASCESIDYLDRNMDNLEVLSLCGDNEEVVTLDQESMRNLYFKQRSNSFESTTPSYMDTRENCAVYDIQNLTSSSIRSLNSSKYDIKELCAKSSSAPVLPRSEKKFECNFIRKPMLRYSRSQSDKYLAEIEAIETCKWLRSAGFPQYAQMFENDLFPIKLSNVKDDHANLGADALRSLYRRLSILNNVAIVKKDTALKFNIKECLDTEDDEPFALSGKWTFEPELNRWSRLDSSSTVHQIPDIAPVKYDYFEKMQVATPVKLRRSGNSRFKDGAKAILKRVESVKLKKRKKRDGMVLSGQEVIKFSEEDSDYYSRLDGFLESKSSDTIDQLGISDNSDVLRDSISHSDSEYHSVRKSFSEENLSRCYNTVDRKSKSYRKTKLRKSDSHFKERNYVVRWHSFQQNDAFLHQNYLYDRISSSEDRKQVFTLSCGEFQMLKKLAVVTLTGLMEKYCPTSKSGWNWDFPNFIKKMKAPVYKEKSIFGVPLIISLQRTGENIPIPIQASFSWLKSNAVDQVGLFRKSGVKSRIAKLRELIENQEDFNKCMQIYNNHQAYDIADMLKQFFRDLPEPLLTSKMSETFIAIFQNIPLECRDDALQCAILLIPDENRDLLYSLLEFLEEISNSSDINQMNKNNLAVCLAPTIFQNFNSNGQVLSSSSKKKKSGAGVPDANKLSEAKGSHECLTYLISNYKSLFVISKEKMMKCKFGFSEPVALENLGKELELSNWRAYVYACTTATIKEGKEKSRGWVSVSSLYPEVEIAYQKVGDGHPLRLWKCVTEVEAPPIDVVDFIKDNRLEWDSSFIEGSVVRIIDDKNDIFRYTIKALKKTTFTVLRSLHTNLSRGACIIIETSVDEESCAFPTGDSKGVVLASRYLIEPCGSGRSKILHFSRVDVKGKSIEWYNKSYGHICSRFLLKIREHFKNVVDGPESKV